MSTTGLQSSIIDNRNNVIEALAKLRKCHGSLLWNKWTPPSRASRTSIATSSNVYVTLCS